MAQSNAAKESGVFFRQWLRSPKSMGSIIPSSRVLGRAVAQQARWQPGEAVIELGGGTGAISTALLEAGVAPADLLVIELDPALCRYLDQRLPGGVRVIEDDATTLPAILARHGVTRVGTVISGIPMVNMPLEFQRAITDAAFAVLPADGFMLQYSYSPVPPIRARKLGLVAKRVDYVVRNVPPASVWRFSRPAATAAVGGSGTRRPQA